MPKVPHKKSPMFLLSCDSTDGLNQENTSIPLTENIMPRYNNIKAILTPKPTQARNVRKASNLDLLFFIYVGKLFFDI